MLSVVLYLSLLVHCILDALEVVSAVVENVSFSLQFLALLFRDYWPVALVSLSRRFLSADFAIIRLFTVVFVICTIKDIAVGTGVERSALAALPVPVLLPMGLQAREGPEDPVTR